jgi:hypothetical protein
MAIVHRCWSLRGYVDISDRITSLLDGEIKERDAPLYFPWLYLKDHLKCCACFIDSETIEFTPPFLPTLTLQAFAGDVKRVYLSATITTKADFTRVFGRVPQQIIAPNVDAGDGERLFLFASEFEKDPFESGLIRQMASKTKVLLAVPSKQRSYRRILVTDGVRRQRFERAI